MSRVLLCISLLIYLSGVALSQTLISDVQVRQLLDMAFANPCVPLHLGKQSLKPLESEHDKDVLDTIRALEKATVVRTADLRKSMNQDFSWDKFTKAAQNPFGVEVDVVLNVSESETFLHPKYTNFRCLRAPQIRVERIAKIDPVKGGNTLKWDGSVVYLTWTRDTGSPLFVAYSRHLPPARQVGSDAKARYLFRHDPFSSQWRLITADFAPIHAQEFTTNKVIAALQRD